MLDTKQKIEKKEKRFRKTIQQGIMQIGAKNKKN